MNIKAKSLCEDLQYEILSWLPPKSLIRYRSVSKSWYSTIHDPSFIKKHSENQSRNDNNRTILVIPKTPSSTICRLYSGKTCEIQSTFNLPFTPVEFYPKDLPQVVSTCNGLVCLVDYYNDGHPFHIWNPSIRILKLVPPCRPLLGQFFSSFGIGFCSQNYCRVVRLTHYYENIVNGIEDITASEADVYSLSTDSWRMVKLDGRVIRRTYKGSVSINGYIYWIAKERRILSFNTNNDSFEEIIHTNFSRLRFDNYHITVLRGKLCMLFEPYFGSAIRDQEHEIWMMREHGVYESWTKLWNIQQGERLSGTLGLGMTVKGELLQCTGVKNENICVYDHENLLYYDLYKGSVVLVVSYMESLVLLDPQKGSRFDKKRKFSNM